MMKKGNLGVRASYNKDVDVTGGRASPPPSEPEHIHEMFAESQGPPYVSIWDQGSQGSPAHRFAKKGSAADLKGDGPGVGYRATIASSPAYSMGARCGPSAFGTPGPGAYKVDEVRNPGRAYTMGYKAGKGFSRVPGPGTYNHELKSGSPSYSMGLRIRSSGEYNDSPGPGAYEVPRKGSSGPAFSIAPKVRPQVTQRDLNPGPGAYAEDHSARRLRGFAFTIRERFRP